MVRPSDSVSEPARSVKEEHLDQVRPSDSVGEPACRVKTEPNKEEVLEEALLSHLCEIPLGPQHDSHDDEEGHWGRSVDDTATASSVTKTEPVNDKEEPLIAAKHEPLPDDSVITISASSGDENDDNDDDNVEGDTRKAPPARGLTQHTFPHVSHWLVRNLRYEGHTHRWEQY